jgi:hypothetical protein
MSRKKRSDRSANQLVANRAQELKLPRDDAFTSYVMDRVLYRLGRSSQAKEFYLKGGVLVANLVDEPYRFTRDIDIARRRGPSDPDDIRDRFRKILRVQAEDGIVFDAGGVKAFPADRDADGYDGVKVKIHASIGAHGVDIQVDVGFGDAVVPAAKPTSLQPFLETDKAARVLAYDAAGVVAEKVETILSKFPAIAHRLKDILDVVVMSEALRFDSGILVKALRATLQRRGTPADVSVLDDMQDKLIGRKWSRDWATMRKDKRVLGALELADAVAKFDAFVRPVLLAVAGKRPSPQSWSPGGPWVRHTHPAP